MVRTRIAAGDDAGMLELTASTARTSGDVVVYGGDSLGIVADTVASGARYNAFTRGRFELPKNTGLPFTAGEDVYWGTSSELTTVQTGATARAGVVARSASTTASAARVNLNAPNVQLAPQT